MSSKNYEEYGYGPNLGLLIILHSLRVSYPTEVGAGLTSHLYAINLPPGPCVTFQFCHSILTFGFTSERMDL